MSTLCKNTVKQLAAGREMFGMWMGDGEDKRLKYRAEKQSNEYLDTGGIKVTGNSTNKKVFFFLNVEFYH